MNKQEKLCRERGYHNFAVAGKGYNVIDCSDDEDDVVLTIRCLDCGAEAELRGDWEYESLQS